MNSTASSHQPADLSSQLIEEFLYWFESNLKKGIVLPKIFSGVTEAGKQFIVDVSALELDRSKHLDFMRYVLRKEGCVAFAHKVRVAALVCKEPEVLQEQHEFYSGCHGSYCIAVLTSRNGEDWTDGVIYTHKSRTVAPAYFMHELLPGLYKATEDDELFETIWLAIREKVQWRTRG